MELISQKDQAKLIMENTTYAPSKPCRKCGLPTGLGVLLCIHCLQEAYLAEELVYTRLWLRDHLDEPVVVGHDKHKLLHLALLRHPLLDVGWCGTKVSQKRDMRKVIKRSEFPATVPEKICELCLAAWDKMGLVA